MQHRVRFEPDGRTLLVPRGSRLLDAVVRADLPLARGCAGHALCGRCGLEILEGALRLPPEEAREREAKQRNRIPRELRLACMTRVTGDLTVTARYWQTP